MILVNDIQNKDKIEGSSKPNVCWLFQKTNERLEAISYIHLKKYDRSQK